jgi:hypothetical protein
MNMMELIEDFEDEEEDVVGEGIEDEVKRSMVSRRSGMEELH